MPFEDSTKLGSENAEALDKLHCFGSRWFCVQMQEAFNAQCAILKEIALKHHSNPSVHSVLPLLHGLQTTSDAISLLRRDGLLNEAHVLMRLLTERAINLCYQLVAPPNTSVKTPSNAKDNKPAGQEIKPHETLLHTLGNLTLTGYNTELSNSPFGTKQVELANSHLDLNAYFAGLLKWDAEW